VGTYVKYCIGAYTVFDNVATIIKKAKIFQQSFANAIRCTAIVIGIQ